MHKLYNFDHGLSYPKTLTLGPFSIEVTLQHCRNRERLYKRPQTAYTYDPNGKPVVKRFEETVAGLFETAVVNTNLQIGGSKLFPAIASTTQLDDLVWVLSFLTGRRVYLHEDLDQFPLLDYSDGVVSNHFFTFAPDFWPNLERVRAEGASTAIEALVQICGNTHLIGMAAYANCALDVLATGWIKKNGLSRYSAAPLIDSVKTLAVEQTTKCLYGRICKALLRLLKNSKCPADTIQDISVRLNNVLQPSALYKLKAFLQGVGFYPAKESMEMYGRLKLLNMVRNRIVHSGDIPRDKKMSYEQALQIAGAVTLIVNEIAQTYIAKCLLQLKDHRIEQSERDICDFFEFGTFRGHRVFEDSYEMFMQKTEDQWTKKGQYPESLE